MSEPYGDRAGRAEAELRRRQEATAAAVEAAAGSTVTHQVDGGNVRVVVDGRSRIHELYVSEYALRAPDFEQRLVAAVNDALALAQTSFAEQVRENVDAQTAALLAATDEFVKGLRDRGDERPGGGR